VSISSLNNVHKAFDDASSATGRAQQAILKYLENRPAKLLLLENTKLIAGKRAADLGKVPVIEQHAVLSKLGYEGLWMNLPAQCFALAQSNPRIYMMYFRAGRGDPVLLRKTLLSLRTTPKKLDDFLDKAPLPDFRSSRPRKGAGRIRRTFGALTRRRETLYDRLVLCPCLPREVGATNPIGKANIRTKLRCKID